jgi:hypothetical protein
VVNWDWSYELPLMTLNQIGQHQDVKDDQLEMMFLTSGRINIRLNALIALNIGLGMIVGHKSTHNSPEKK